MTDIVERLRCHNAYTVKGADVCNEGAAEIERLRAALRPFAEYAAAFEANVSTLFADDDSLWRCPGVADLTLGDCRRARAAYEA